MSCTMSWFDHFRVSKQVNTDHQEEASRWQVEFEFVAKKSLVCRRSHTLVEVTVVNRHAVKSDGEFADIDHICFKPVNQQLF